MLKFKRKFRRLKVTTVLPQAPLFHLVPKNFVMINITDGVPLNLFKRNVIAVFPFCLCLFGLQMSRRGTRCVIGCKDTPEKFLSLISVSGQMRERKVPTTQLFDRL